MANGDVYDGEWFNDRAHGYGIKTFLNGDFHEGEYRHDVRELHGIYQWANGDEYDGNWDAGELSGLGIYTYANGDIFEGRWKHGQKHGPGYFKPHKTDNDVHGPNIFFEVWSHGRRMHRENISHMDVKKLPSMAELCQSRSLHHMARAQKKFSSSRNLMTKMTSTTSPSMVEDHERVDDHHHSDMSLLADRWRWAWESNMFGNGGGPSGFWTGRMLMSHPGSALSSAEIQEDLIHSHEWQIATSNDASPRLFNDEGTNAEEGSEGGKPRSDETLVASKERDSDVEHTTHPETFSNDYDSSKITSSNLKNQYGKTVSNDPNVPPFCMKTTGCDNDDDDDDDNNDNNAKLPPAMDVLGEKSVDLLIASNKKTINSTTKLVKFHTPSKSRRLVGDGCMRMKKKRAVTNKKSRRREGIVGKEGPCTNEGMTAFQTDDDSSSGYDQGDCKMNECDIGEE